MRGMHRIVVQNRRVRYDFEVRRNLTVVRGDSASGKTTLVEMIQEYYEYGEESGISLNCDKQCAVLSGNGWRANLAMLQDSIIFIDEGNKFVLSDEFASAIQKTDNYYVIITRDSIPSLPYSAEEIYGIRSSGKYGTLSQIYHEFYHLYWKEGYPKSIAPKIVIVEDSNSGYQFFRNVTKKAEIECVNAGGKSNIFTEILKIIEMGTHDEILVIADGAAFGAELERLMKLMKTHKEIALYLPESFEWLILKSGVIEDRELIQILDFPADYIDSQKYFSGERFFTFLLVDKAKDTYLKYTKRNLNPAYLNEKIKKKILKVLKGIEFYQKTTK